MTSSHETIFTAGVLCLCAIFAGLASARIGTPLLLVFIGVGMLAGEDGLGGIRFNDLHTAYLVGSLALAAILFGGGLTTEREILRDALWPSAVLATLGVGVSALVVAVAAVKLLGVSWPVGGLIGSVLAPTDAAAVSVLLRMSNAKIPPRLTALLETESGLNDPMSVFLTVLMIELARYEYGAGQAVRLFAQEMGGGLLLGLAGGYAMLWLFRRLRTDRAVFPVLATGGALTVFGGAQMVGASGFLAVYLAGVVVGNYDHPAGEPVARFFNAVGWLAQISLFLMLGLLVTPHELPPFILPALGLCAVSILIARPAAVAVSLIPFRMKPREISFVAWVGLRGAVPIFLTAIPMLEGLPESRVLFNIVFVVVVVSVAIQGWTIGPVARRLKL